MGSLETQDPGFKASVELPARHLLHDRFVVADDSGASRAACLDPASQGGQHLEPSPDGARPAFVAPTRDSGGDLPISQSSVSGSARVEVESQGAGYGRVTRGGLLANSDSHRVNLKKKF